MSYASHVIHHSRKHWSFWSLAFFNIIWALTLNHSGTILTRMQMTLKQLIFLRRSHFLIISCLIQTNGGSLTHLALRRRKYRGNSGNTPHLFGSRKFFPRTATNRFRSVFL